MAIGQLLLSGTLRSLSILSDNALRAGSRALFGGSWKRFEDAVERPREVQEARLLTLLERAKDTEFGKEHNFAEIRSLADYQKQVPIRNYEGFEPYLDRMLQGEQGVLIPDAPIFFGRSSGTTGTPKHIPVTQVYTAEYRQPRRVWARQVMQAFPGLVRGKILSMHSPKIEGHTPGGIPTGSVTVGLSGAKPTENALSGGPLDAVPREVFLIEDFELKYYTILRVAAQQKISLAAAINPSTLVLLAKKLSEYAEQLIEDLEQGTHYRADELPGTIAQAVKPLLKKDAKAAQRIRDSLTQHQKVVATELWPDVAGLVCWKGGSAPFYLEQLEEYFPGRQAMDYGYLATEGGFSIPLSPEGSKGVVSVLGHVLEFLPEGEVPLGKAVPALLANELEPGKRYRVLVTGAHGLYRYDINDVVECVGKYRNTAEVIFVHKGGNMLSITGEKVGESHVVHAANYAEKHAGQNLTGFSVVCELSDPPRYVFAVEPTIELAPDAAQKLLSGFDEGLKKENMEYLAKRDSLRLGPPKLAELEQGAFDQERSRKVAAGAPDSHVKPPHLSRDPELLERLGVRREFEL